MSNECTRFILIISEPGVKPSREKADKRQRTFHIAALRVTLKRVSHPYFMKRKNPFKK